MLLERFPPKPNWVVKRAPTQAMPSAFLWPVLVPCAPSVLRRRLPWALGLHMAHRLSARKIRSDQALTPELVHRIAASLLPRRNDYGTNTYDDLVTELANFGIKKRGSFTRLMKRHRKQLIQIDRDPLLPWEVTFFSQEFGESFVQDALRRQYWFALPAMIRTALELEFGEAAAIYEEATST